MSTFVLVPGAFHGGWCWKKVVPLLRAMGHEVYTPTLTGLGERSHLLNRRIDLQTHIQDIVNLLEFEDLKGCPRWTQLREYSDRGSCGKGTTTVEVSR